MSSSTLRLAIAGAGLSACILACAQSADPLLTAPAQIRVGIERTRLPGGEHMGLVGTSYLIGVGRGLSIGPAIYGAASGRRGGMFTLGAEAGWQGRIAGPLTLDAGLYAGGGGGGAAPVGGGLMLRPHVDLLWDFGPFLAGLSASRVRFPNGDIDSRQLGLVFSARTDFRYVPRERIGERSDLGGRTGLGVDRFHTVIGFYDPRPGARRVGGGALPARITQVGVRAERSLGDHSYIGVEGGGAGGGGVAGYAEFLGTAGAETTVWPDTFTLGTRVALGMGGGGDVDTGGGLLWKAGVYGTVRLARELGLSLEAGVARAPQGSFKATYAAASLNWILDDPSDLTAPPRNTRTEWMGGVERYDAQRRDGTRLPLRAVVLKTSRFVTRHVYVTGQARSAYAGAGGYTAGLVGAGVQLPLGTHWHIGAEALVGAGGGGGVETSGGAVMQPNAYLGFDLTPSLALRAGAGRVRSFKSGGLDASMVELGVAFTFGVAGHGYR